MGNSLSLKDKSGSNQWGYDEKIKGEPGKVEEPDMSRTYTAGDYINWTFEGLYPWKGSKMSPAPLAGHQRVLARMARIFLHYFQPGQKCEVFFAPFDVFLLKPDQHWKETEIVLEPDLCIVCDPAKV